MINKNGRKVQKMILLHRCFVLIKTIVKQNSPHLCTVLFKALTKFEKYIFDYNYLEKLLIGYFEI